MNNVGDLLAKLVPEVLELETGQSTSITIEGSLTPDELVELTRDLALRTTYYVIISLDGNVLTVRRGRGL